MKYLKKYENNKAQYMIGTIQKNGVLGEDGVLYRHATRGTDKHGYPEVLMDAKEVGGRGIISRQSIKPFIGMIIRFIAIPGKPESAYNHTIFKEDNLKEEKHEDLKYWMELLNLYLDKIDIKIVNDYLLDSDNFLELQDHVGENIKKEFDWLTTMGIIDSIELMIKEAKNNGNI
jgi:hypothetical protein